MTMRPERGYCTNQLRTRITSMPSHAMAGCQEWLPKNRSMTSYLQKRQRCETDLGGVFLQTYIPNVMAALGTTLSM